MTTAPLNRRLLAILAVDVVGYSRLMDQDESGTIARLQTVRTEVRLVFVRLLSHGQASDQRKVSMILLNRL